MPGTRYLTQSQAAKALGISWRTFEKRRKAGIALYQADHTDPDSHRRTYNEATLLAALDEAGREKVRRQVAS